MWRRPSQLLRLPPSHPLAQVNGAQGSLAVTRRQLEAAEQEAAALDRQLQSGLQVGADGGAAPAAPATPLRVVEEQTHAVEQEKKAKSDRLAGVRRLGGAHQWVDGGGGPAQPLGGWRRRAGAVPG